MMRVKQAVILYGLANMPFLSELNGPQTYSFWYSHSSKTSAMGRASICSPLGGQTAHQIP